MMGATADMNAVKGGAMTKKGARDERRRAPRVRCELWANWVRRSGDVEATVADIAERGLFLRSTTLPTVTELVQLEVYPPGEMTPVPLLAVVRSIRRSGDAVGFGVELRVMDDTTRARWQALLAAVRARGG